jgi:hypothetical protein
MRRPGTSITHQRPRTRTHGRDRHRRLRARPDGAESDIDLLFILPYKQTAWGEQVAEAILYCLWDMGLKVGHATRSIDESIRQARADMTIRTSVLETRSSPATKHSTKNS